MDESTYIINLFKRDLGGNTDNAELENGVWFCNTEDGNGTFWLCRCKQVALFTDEPKSQIGVWAINYAVRRMYYTIMKNVKDPNQKLHFVIPYGKSSRLRTILLGELQDLIGHLDSGDEIIVHYKDEEQYINGSGNHNQKWEEYCLPPVEDYLCANDLHLKEID